MKLELELKLRKIECRAGDLVIVETEDRLTERQLQLLRDQFGRVKLPEGVAFALLEKGLDVRVMHDDEKRALLDALCSSLNMRAVPL